MSVVYTSRGGNSWAQMRNRYTTAQAMVATNLHEAIPEILAGIRDDIDDGPGGIAHIDTGNLNDSLHGENADSIEIKVETDDGFIVVIGSLDPAAVFQARRFGDREGPVVPLDPEKIRAAISEHFIPDLKAGA